MNKDSIYSRGYKTVIEDILGFQLIVEQLKSSRYIYYLCDGLDTKIKKFQTLPAIISFISTTFNYSYSDLILLVQSELVRLKKENQQIDLKDRIAELENLDSTNIKHIETALSSNEEQVRDKTERYWDVKYCCPYCNSNDVKISKYKGNHYKYICGTCGKYHNRNQLGYVISVNKKVSIGKKIK